MADEVTERRRASYREWLRTHPRPPRPRPAPPPRRWRPHTGGEADAFVIQWCERCTKMRDCPLMFPRLMFPHDQLPAPEEWVLQGKAPVCTIFEPRPEGAISPTGTDSDLEIAE